MAIETLRASEKDRERLELLAGALDSDATEEDFAPGTLGCHELLDRTSLVLKLLEESIRTHPSCLLKPEWFELADRASQALADLYQRVGSEHLSVDVRVEASWEQNEPE